MSFSHYERSDEVWHQLLLRLILVPDVLADEQDLAANL